jgi:hypothetical protein
VGCWLLVLLAAVDVVVQTNEKEVSCALLLHDTPYLYRYEFVLSVRYLHRFPYLSDRSDESTTSQVSRSEVGSWFMLVERIIKKE